MTTSSPAAMARRGSVVVSQSKLEPQRLRADHDGLGGDRREILRAAKDIDDVGDHGQIGKRGVHAMTEDLGGLRVDEEHLELRFRQ